MQSLDDHAQTYAQQPERREAYLRHLAQERLVAELAADLVAAAPAPKRGAKPVTE